jgi:thiamine pyrophosphate-dependent acetolactate synthase large subunit-like protein
MSVANPEQLLDPAGAEASNEVMAQRLFGRILRDQGVDSLFFMLGMGGPDSPAVTSCIEAGIKGYYVRHEGAAAMMAHGYARMSGKCGVCVTSLGPGTTNALTGVANAYLDASPMILLGAAAPGTWLGREGYQEQDQLSVFKPVVKAAHRVEVASRIPEMVALAHHEAMSGRRGPVYLDLPVDVMDRPLDPDNIFWPEGLGELPKPAISEHDLDRIADLVEGAERPLVMVGSGIVWSGAEKSLREFVEGTGLPLVTTPQVRGVLPEAHELTLTASRNRATREADVVIVIGTRPNWINAHFRAPRFDRDVRFVNVNIEPEDVGRLTPAEIGVVADADVALRQLVARLGGSFGIRERSDWVRGLVAKDVEVARRENPAATDESTPINPLRMCHEIKQLLPSDAIFVVDGHETLEFARRSIPSESLGNYLTSGPNGCMGVGVPMAIGAQVACPDRPVVVLMGDGGFGWHGMEYDTAIRHELPITGIVMNNAGFTSRPTGGSTGRDLGYQRYERVVSGLGGQGERVTEPAEIRPALERALAATVPSLVNICVDQDAAAPGGLLGASGIEGTW